MNRTEPPRQTVSLRELRAGVPPARGLLWPGAGRASHVGRAVEYQGVTSQVCGLFPFVAGSGAPAMGVPIGRHMLWGESVSLDPLLWLESGLVTNPGIFVIAAPGTGKSALIKRVMRGMAGFGVRPFVLGDLKGEHVAVVERLGGQVVRVGRGLDRINPLDTGPLGQAAAQLTGPAAIQLRAEVRGRRLNALTALLTLVRRSPITNAEECILGAILDTLDERRRRQGIRTEEPTIPDVLFALRLDRGIEQHLMAVADVGSVEEFRADTKALFHTLNLLTSGSLKGVFDSPTSKPIDLNAPAVCVDISHVASAGDTLVAAALLSTWSYGYSLIDGSAALADAGLAPRRRYLVVLDELWRALRGSPGLVDAADALTRVNRAKGVADIRATHSLQDLEALPTEEDRAKARGFVERAGVVVLGGLSPKELDAVSAVVPLSSEERTLVAGWCAPESWAGGSRHPGRGKYLLKSGGKIGIPVQLEYVGDEAQLYDTDARVLAVRQ